jgi:hypothetical protein
MWYATSDKAKKAFSLLETQEEGKTPARIYTGRSRIHLDGKRYLLYSLHERR